MYVVCHVTGVYICVQVGESIQRQDELVARINSAHAKFLQETQQHGTSARDTVLKELAAGFDTYQELMGNLQEGTQVCTAIVCVLAVFDMLSSAF